jgi:hypothetical protein
MKEARTAEEDAIKRIGEKWGLEIFGFGAPLLVLTSNWSVLRTRE